MAMTRGLNTRGYFGRGIIPSISEKRFAVMVKQQEKKRCGF
jgi:hypothetical protein